MTRDEESLLLYLETCAVDERGGVQELRMNLEDQRIAEEWNKSGYIKYGRIAARTIPPQRGRARTTHWVRLSDAAWRDVHELRRVRADRAWPKRRWATVPEYRAGIHSPADCGECL